MRSKVVAAEMATAAGIEAVIASGLAPGSSAPPRRASASARAAGRRPAVLVVQALAQVRQAAPGPRRHRRGRRARAARGRHQPAARGGRRRRGEFDAGDAVEVARDGGEVIGKGISNYSADELRSVKGLQSAQVREGLPQATEEAVHRDYFVLA